MTAIAQWKYALTTAQALKKIKELQKRPHRDLGWWFDMEDVSNQVVPDGLHDLARRDEKYGFPSTYRTTWSATGRRFMPDTVILTIYREARPPVNKQTAG